jgi:hypothetical protein
MGRGIEEGQVFLTHEDRNDFPFKPELLGEGPSQMQVEAVQEVKYNCHKLFGTH